MNQDRQAAQCVADALSRHVAGSGPLPSWPGPVDATAFRRVVHRNRADPLFGFLFSKAEPAQGWEATRTDWIQAYKRCLLHGTKHLENGLRVCEALEGTGIPALPMRGPFCGSTLYGDVATRYFTDLDILIPRDKVDEAWEVVSGLGYRLSSPILTRAMYLRHHLAWPLHNGDVCLDLHWALDHPYAPYTVDYGALFEGSRLDGGPDGRWRVADPGHLVLVNCLHLAKEWGSADVTGFGLTEAMLRGELTPCLDVALAVRAAGPLLDWPSVRALAHDWNMDRPLAMGAAVLRDLGMDAPVDLPALTGCAPSATAPSWLVAVTKSRPVQRVCVACAFRAERILDAYGVFRRPNGGWRHLCVTTATAALDGVRCYWRLRRYQRGA